MINLIEWQEQKRRKFNLEGNYPAGTRPSAIAFDEKTTQVTYEFNKPPQLLIVSDLSTLTPATNDESLPQIKLKDEAEKARDDLVRSKKDDPKFRDDMHILISGIQYDEQSNILYFEVSQVSYSALLILMSNNSILNPRYQFFKTGALAPLITTDNKMVLSERSKDGLYSVPSGFLEAMGEKKQLNWEHSNLAVETAKKEIKEEVAGVKGQPVQRFSYTTLGITALSFRKTEGNPVGTAEFVVPFKANCTMLHLENVLKDRQAKDEWEQTDKHVFINVTPNPQEMLDEMAKQQCKLPGWPLFLPIIKSVAKNYNAILHEELVIGSEANFYKQQKAVQIMPSIATSTYVPTPSN